MFGLKRSLVCCEVMERMLAGVGERGLAIVIERDPNGQLVAGLQSRGVDHTDTAAFVAEVPSNIGVNISRTARIYHCPWCGRRVSKMLSRNQEHWNALAAEHQKYVKS